MKIYYAEQQESDKQPVSEPNNDDNNESETTNTGTTQADIPASSAPTVPMAKAPPTTSPPDN